MSGTSATTVQNSANITPKASKEQIIGVKVVTNNAANALKITELDFNSNGTTNTSEIKNAKVYYTGNSTVFDTTTRFGANITAPGASSFLLTGNQTLVRGDNYFWLVYNVIPCATVGNAVDAECTLIKYDSMTTIKSKTPIITAPTGSRQIQTMIQESFTASVPLANGWTSTIISGTQNFTRVTAGTFPTNTPYSAPGMVQFNAWSTTTGSQAEMFSPSFDWLEDIEPFANTKPVIPFGDR